jgi:hypothetical protein
VANLVSSDSNPELSLPSHFRVREVDLIVNARVATDPGILERFVSDTSLKAGEAREAQVQFHQTQGSARAGLFRLIGFLDRLVRDSSHAASL